MELQLLFNEYLNMKFNRGLPSVQTDGFEYGLPKYPNVIEFFNEEARRIYL